MRVKKNQHRYYIAIYRNYTELIYIGAVTEEEMPYGMARGVSSSGELLHNYQDYRNTLKFREGGYATLTDNEIPPERFKALPDDIVISYDMKKCKLPRIKTNKELKLLDMFYKGETEWFGISEEREKKLNIILL